MVGGQARRLRGLAGAIGFATLLGCAAGGEALPRHIVMFDDEGAAVDATADPLPFQSFPVLDKDAYEQWVDRIMEDVEAFDPAKHDCRRMAVERPGAAKERQQETVKENAAEEAQAGARPAVVRVLLFIHGGMNTPDGTIQRATHLHDRIVKAGYYPIFINWNSSLLSSYWSHLWSVRQGDERPWAPVTSPLWFLADVTRGVVRLPVTWWWRVQDSFDLADDRKRADAVFKSTDKQGLQIYRAQGDHDVDGTFLGGLWEFLMMPVRAAATLVVDTGGTGSWNAMQRRVELLFDRDEFVPDAMKGRTAPPDPTPLMRFMERLHAKQAELEEQGRRLEVTLIGHSMGSMVANRLLQRGMTFGDDADSAAPKSRAEQSEKAATHRNFTVPVFQDVVYMAAACSILQYEASAFPYLEQHEHTRFFHVMLDPDSETRETYLAALSPKGSLLVWIDDFLSSPYTLDDRTAGRYVNLLPALHHTPEALRERVFVKLFDDGDSDYPQKHGEFGDKDFWTEQFWWK